jgi:phosphate transport system substrate-binding protein
MNTKKICKKLVRDAHAVSPIIATLMLVLVAVGSAGAFYAWQTGWQKDNTESMSDFNTKSNLLIGGSSTVYEFTAVAGPMFEQARPDIKVSFQSGGSGSGVIGVGEGVVDIGSASRYVKSTEYEDYPDLIEHTVAYDAIVMIVSDDNVHANNTQLTTTEIRAVYYINGRAASWNTGPNDVQTWAKTFNVSGVGVFYYDNATDLVKWSDDNTQVNIYERADHSGTEDVFCDKLLDEDEKQLDEFDITATTVTGNAALLSTLADDPHGLSFMSFGAAKESNDVEMLNIDFGTGTPIEPTETNIKAGDYKSYRPINYITLGEPTGYAKMYLEFVRGTMMNQDIADECGYMSIY